MVLSQYSRNNMAIGTDRIRLSNLDAHQQLKLDGLEPGGGVWLTIRHSDAEALHRQLPPRYRSIDLGNLQIEAGEPEPGVGWVWLGIWHGLWRVWVRRCSSHRPDGVSGCVLPRKAGAPSAPFRTLRMTDTNHDPATTITSGVEPSSAKKKPRNARAAERQQWIEMPH